MSTFEFFEGTEEEFEFLVDEDDHGMVYVGFLIDRFYDDGDRVPDDLWSELFDSVVKLIDEAGLPGVLDYWHAWHDDGAYFVGARMLVETLRMVLLGDDLPDVGLHVYTNYPDFFYEDPTINPTELAAKWQAEGIGHTDTL